MPYLRSSSLQRNTSWGSRSFGQPQDMRGEGAIRRELASLGDATTSKLQGCHTVHFVCGPLTDLAPINNVARSCIQKSVNWRCLSSHPQKAQKLQLFLDGDIQHRSADTDSNSALRCTDQPNTNKLRQHPHGLLHEDGNGPQPLYSGISEMRWWWTCL